MLQLANFDLSGSTGSHLKGIPDIRMTMVNENVPRRERVAVFQNAVTVIRGIINGGCVYALRRLQQKTQNMGHQIPDRHSLAAKLVSPGESIPWTQQAPVESPA